jgi:hypothetical protein
MATYYDAPFRVIGEIGAKTMQAYAARHGYDARIVTAPLTDRPAPWNKIPVIQQLFKEGYAHVCWIDADAVIVDQAADIRRHMQDGKDMHLVRVRHMEGEIPSTGVFLIRNSAWSRALLAALWNMRQYTHHPLWENMAFCDYMGLAHLLSARDSEGVPDSVRAKRPDPARMAHVAWLPTEWNWVWLGTGAQRPPIIRHYPAMPLYARRYCMARDAYQAGLMPLGSWMRAFGAGIWHYARNPARIAKHAHWARGMREVARDLARIPLIWLQK